ncbi:MAG: sugar phosphate isomerase/epimerase [Planctomycetaceae bacterium]|nr:sugar phosphate isomerase/epimerase [Planctomycetaceae bacterium]
MVRLSINELTTYRWHFEEDVERYVAAEIPAVGVWRQKLSDFGEDKGVELLADSGLKVSNLLWAGGFTGSDGRSYRDGLDDAAEAIRLAAALQTDSLVVYSGGRSGHTHNHARRILREALETILPLAEQQGVNLALEPMHPECAAEWTFLTSLEDTLSLIKSLNHPRLKLVFDSYHFGHDPALIARLPELVKHLAVVHLADGHAPPGREQNRTPLGTGSLPLREIVAALITAGYDGYFDVEIFGESVAEADYAELLEHSKRAMADLCTCASSRT